MLLGSLSRLEFFNGRLIIKLATQSLKSLKDLGSGHQSGFDMEGSIYTKRSEAKIYVINIPRVCIYECMYLPYNPHHNEELHSLYRSPNIVRVIKSIRLGWAGHVARMEEGRRAFKILAGKPTGKRPLGRPRRRSEDNIGMDLEEIGINAGNWVDSAQDRNYWRALVNEALNLRVP